MSVARPVGALLSVVATALLTITVVQAAQLNAYPEFVLFTLMVFAPPIVVVVRQLVLRKPIDVLSPFVLFPLTMGIVYGRAPELLSLEGREGIAVVVARALIFGIAAYYCGVIFWRTVSPADKGRHPLPQPAYLSSNVIYGTYFVGVASMLAFWLRAGGIPILQGDLENARVSALTGSGVPFYLSMLMMIACWLSLDPRATISMSIKVWMFAGATLLLSTTGWRNTVFALLVVALLMRHYQRPIKSGLLLACGLLAVLGAVGIGIYRVYSSGIQTYLTYQQVARGDYLAATWTYLVTYADAFARNLATVFKVVPSSLDFQGGTTLIWNFLSLAPDSDLEPFDFVLKRAAGEGFEGGGLPPTLVGEWYLNFGWIGIVVGMAIIGVVAELSHRAITTGRNPVSRLIGILIVYYLFVSVRGGLGNVALTIVWLALSILVVSRIATRSIQAGEAAQNTDARQRQSAPDRRR